MLKQRIFRMMAILFIVFISGTAIFAKGVYPIKTDTVLTCWGPLNSSTALAYKSLGDTPLYKELEKKTGIKVRFIHPVAGNELEQFNIMLASGNLPDIIEFTWFTIPGGVEKALQDGYIVPLNNLLDKDAPNLKKVINSNKDLVRQIKTDSGKIAVFPFIRSDDSLVVFAGPFLRNDWLKELGLKVPTTIDEWYHVLKAFKEKKNCTAPLTFFYGSNPNTNAIITTNAFIGAFGTTMDFYLNKNKVVYGPIQSQYKNFLATFHKWYSEGLIDKDFGLIDRKTLDAKMTNGQAGASIGNSGSGIGRYMDANENNPKYDLVAAPYPTLKKGVIPEFGHRTLKISLNDPMAAITSSCKNKKLAARWLDYGYSEEGHMLFNFGIKGVSYDLVNGFPKYSNLLLNNPDGLNFGQALASYTRANYNGSFVQDKRYLEQYLVRSQQKVAIGTWAKTNEANHLMPNMTPTVEESAELARIKNEINTYRDEMTLKFIMGIEPLDNFDKYVATLKKLGAERAIKIYQDALTRYIARWASPEKLDTKLSTFSSIFEVFRGHATN